MPRFRSLATNFAEETRWPALLCRDAEVSCARVRAKIVSQSAALDRVSAFWGHRSVWNENFLREGWPYLRARNFVHHCTDGPECPAAYAFSRKEAGQLFAKFADVRMTVAHFPLRRYRIGQLIPFGLEKWLAFNIGWYLFIDAAKPVPT